MNSVNSLITTFKPKKKTSIAYVIDARGEIITLSNGCVSVKSLIIEFETKIEKTIVSICANFLVHFDFENSHSNLVKDYSPIACLQVEGEAKTKKLYNVDHPFFIPFKHVNIVQLGVTLLLVRQRMCRCRCQYMLVDSG